jgi:hypothetical protein
MSFGGDVAPFSAVRALRDGSPRQIGPVIAEHGTEGQWDQPVGAAGGAHDHRPQHSLRPDIPSVRERTVN